MPKEETKKIGKKQTISRREFLKDAGLLVGGATVGSMSFINACGGTTTITAPGTISTKTVTGPGATITTTVTQLGTGVVTTTVPGPTITKVEPAVSEVLDKLTINGKVYELKIEPHSTLQQVLRDKLSLGGSAKTFCDRGACGSCTVNIDKRPVLSCMTLAIECEGKSIETIEGIAAAKHPVIEAYIANDVAQCGYCIPGFIVTAKALLEKNSDPSTEDIKEALGGNLCRCGTYARHVSTIKQAAQALKGGK